MKNQEKQGKPVALLLCLTAVFAAGFFAVFIHGGYTDKVLVKLGLKEKEKSVQNLTAMSWDRCLGYMGVDCDIAMFGDSITSDGNFSAYFPDVKICNLGLSGDGLSDMNERIYMLQTVKPEKVFVLGGINTLRDSNYESTLGQYRQLAENLREKLDAEIYIISILPVSEEKAKTHASNPTISRFNSDLAEFAAETGITYIDLASYYLKDGAMNPDYTTEGIHLNKAGYDLWARVLEDYIR